MISPSRTHLVLFAVVLCLTSVTARRDEQDMLMLESRVAVEGIADTWDEVKSSVADVVPKALKSVQDDVTGFIGKAQKKIDGIANTVKGAAAGITEQADNAFKQMLADNQMGLAAALDDVKKLISQIKKLDDIIIAGMGKFVEWMKKLKDAVAGECKNPPRWLLHMQSVVPNNMGKTVFPDALACILTAVVHLFDWDVNGFLNSGLPALPTPPATPRFVEQLTTPATLTYECVEDTADDTEVNIFNSNAVLTNRRKDADYLRHIGVIFSSTSMICVEFLAAVDLGSKVMTIVQMVAAGINMVFHFVSSTLFAMCDAAGHY